MPLALAWFWWGGGILYAILLITAGVMTIRNGRFLLFVLGFFLPLLWIGAFWDRPRVIRTERESRILPRAAPNY